MKNSIKTLTRIVALLFVTPLPAMAQTVVAPAAAQAEVAAAAPQGLEEVVVTSTRRATSLQQVPGVVQAISSSTLTALNINGTEALGQLVPGLTINRSGGIVPFLRGLGVNNSGYATEMPIAIYIDGLYLPNSSGGLFSFTNIERIEVLKGPQGTLYGRNSTGGLINIITSEPDGTPSVDASLGFASYQTVTANVYGSTAIADNLFASVAVFHEKQSKGWGRNIFTGRENMKSEETGVQAKLVYKPAAGTKIILSGIYNYNNSDKGLVQAIFPGSIGSDGTPYLGRYRNSARRDASAPYTASTGSLKIEQDAGFASLMSLTGYQTSHQQVMFTQNAIPGNPVAGQSATESNIYGKNETFSQEFQLSSKPSASPFDWILGAFYYHDNTTQRLENFQTCVGAVCAPGTPNRLTGYPTIRSESAYADGTYKILPGTRLTLGLRYTRDDKALTGLAEPLPGLPNSVAALPANTLFHPGDPFLVAGVLQPGIPTSFSQSKLTYRAVLAQDFTKDIHAYISANRGFRSGTFSAVNFNNPPVRPEILDHYEVGLKSELFDRRLRLNLAVFNYNYTDIQVRSTAPPALPGVPIAINAAAARVKGIDADFQFVATNALSVMGGFEYLSAKYSSFPGGTCSTPRPAPAFGVVTVACDLSGRSLINAPKYSATLGVQYRIETSHGQFALAVNDEYKSSFPLTLDNSLQQAAKHLLNSSLTWSPVERYSVQLYGKNLTDRYYFVGAQTAGTSNIYRAAAPRTFGMNLRYRF